jgi:hypothetical protein
MPREEIRGGPQKMAARAGKVSGLLALKGEAGHERFEKFVQFEILLPSATEFSRPNPVGSILRRQLAHWVPKKSDPSVLLHFAAQRSGRSRLLFRGAQPRGLLVFKKIALRDFMDQRPEAVSTFLTACDDPSHLLSV